MRCVFRHIVIVILSRSWDFNVIISKGNLEFNSRGKGLLPFTLTLLVHMAVERWEWVK